MKRTVALFSILLMVSLMAACGGQDEKIVENETMSETYSTGKEENLGLSETKNSQNTVHSNKDSNILIAYFTYGENAGFTGNVDASSSASIQLFNGRVTGNTGVMAQMISDVSGGDLFSIRTVELYPENYNDTVNIGKEEKNNNARPKLSTHVEVTI